MSFLFARRGAVTPPRAPRRKDQPKKQVVAFRADLRPPGHYSSSSKIHYYLCRRRHLTARGRAPRVTTAVPVFCLDSPEDEVQALAIALVPNGADLRIVCPPLPFSRPPKGQNPTCGKQSPRFKRTLSSGTFSVCKKSSRTRLLPGSFANHGIVAAMKRLNRKMGIHKT